MDASNNVRMNLRSGLPIRFGNDETRLDYERSVDVLRSHIGTGRYAVAPLVTVERTRKGTLKVGDAVEPADLLPEYNADGEVETSPLVRFNQLVRDGFVVEGI